MPKFARWLLAALPLVLLAACAKPEREFESAPEPGSSSPALEESQAAAPGEPAPSEPAVPLADSAWDGADLATLPDVSALAEPQLSIELGRRALLQARGELREQEYARVAESVDVAKQALARVRPTEAADGQALTTVTTSLGQILPGTAAEFDQLIAALATARGPVLTALPAAPLPTPDAATVGPEPGPAAPAGPTGEGPGETPASAANL